ncbi:hypothetical protein [Paenibacillus oralis]|uniref:hypothetical protein n=1 Tax=Paenibacillus oralis TaxID=2490856 RepID=UPI0015AC4311|nr:hypothetical protein [Paenibacillus oralis]
MNVKLESGKGRCSGCGWVGDVRTIKADNDNVSLCYACILELLNLIEKDRQASK